MNKSSMKCFLKKKIGFFFLIANQNDDLTVTGCYSPRNTSLGWTSPSVLVQTKVDITQQVIESYRITIK